MATLKRGGDRRGNQHSKWQPASLPLATISQAEAAKMVEFAGRAALAEPIPTVLNCRSWDGFATPRLAFAAQPELVLSLSGRGRS
jgi:hypothetical protein